MENKPIIEKDGYLYQIVRKVVKSYKPIRNKEGSIKYSDALQYLVRTLPQDHPSYNTILSLASYASCNNGLTQKQRDLANKFISWYEKLWENKDEQL